MPANPMLIPNQRQVAPKNSHLIIGATSARVALKDNVLHESHQEAMKMLSSRPEDRPAVGRLRIPGHQDVL